MTPVSEKNEIKNLAQVKSTKFSFSNNEAAIILAAGHGKRIKSHTSKMLHKIWEIPTVERVYNSCKKGFDNLNIIVVVGIKAIDVINVIGKRENTLFAYQEEQNGTGHAVQVALEKFESHLFDGRIYVLPGDMGLIDSSTLKIFKEKFVDSKFDMMVLTGLFEGDVNDNSYGRILRVKEFDNEGNSSTDDYNHVIEILEFKDILKLNDIDPYNIKFNGKMYSFTKEELINNREFNSGVFAFDSKKLSEQILNLKNNNAQNEIYITDLISLFNKNNYSVGAVTPEKQHV